MTQVELTGPVTTPWHLGHTRVPAPGTRVHLMLLVGRGVVRSAPFRAGSADCPGTLGTHVQPPEATWRGMEFPAGGRERRRRR